MNTSTLLDSFILIKPPKVIAKSFNIKINSEFKKTKCPKIQQQLILTSSDYDFLKFLDEKYNAKTLSTDPLNKNVDTFPSESKNKTKQFLKIDDLLWLFENSNNQNCYFHEFLKNSTVHVPENKQVKRNPTLQKCCEKLKNELENKKYQSMTKNVDNVRVQHPEDTIQYQMTALNRQLIAIFQFIVSIATGFTFGFIGVELMTGPLSFGCKILLGIMCSFIVALAELYFLTKQLREK